MVLTPAIEPAANVFPSIIAASSSLTPSLVNTAPLPALKRGLFSSTFTVASTASNAVPPFSKIELPTRSALSSPLLYFASSAGVNWLLLSVPAPP